ncbi:MAG: hypothetical protein PVJ76_19660 [Gemmatimonadota bacterium]
MWQISDDRLRFGAFLGAVVIPFSLVGFWHVYQGIKDAGRLVSAVPVLVGCYAGALGSAAHFSLLFPAMVGRAISGSGGETLPVLEQLHADMASATSGLFWVVLGFVIFSIWWMILVLIGKTKYPRWFGMLNPTFLMIGLSLCLPLMPGTVGSYLFPASSALSFAVFFAFSTALLWNWSR